MIDGERGRIDMGKGIAAFAQRGIEVVGLGGDSVGVERIAGDDGEAFPQGGIVGPGAGEGTQIDRAKAVAHTGHNIEAHQLGGCITPVRRSSSFAQALDWPHKGQRLGSTGDESAAMQQR